MEQRTMNIINVCKGNTKYSKNAYDHIEAIKAYMSDECMYKVEWYTDEQIENIITTAFKDYLDACDKPSYFIYLIEGVIRTHNYILPEPYKITMINAICIAFSLVQIRDWTGESFHYINGFDDRIKKLDI